MQTGEVIYFLLTFQILGSEYLKFSISMILLFPGLKSLE